MRFLLPILTIYLALVCALIARVPPGHAPDEVAHVDYVRYIAQHRALPKFESVAPPNFGYEFHQPPLYYLLCAPGGNLPGDAAIYFCRAVSAVFGLLTLLLIWKAARELWPQREDLAALATGAAAVWPLHLGVSAVAGNDALAGFFCAALFFLIARGAVRGWTMRDAVLAGLCAGLGLWTKNTTVVVSLAALGAALTRPLPEGEEFKAALPQPLPEGGEHFSPPLGRGWGRVEGRGRVREFALVAFLIALPLFLRNQSLYGDPLGWKAFAAAASAGTPGYPQFSQNGLDFFTYARGLLLILFCTFWGFFGGPDTAVKAIVPFNPKPFPVELLPPVLICFAALPTLILGLLRLKDNEEIRAPAAVWRWWAVGVALIFLGWAKFAYDHFSGGQARYLHPALLPFCVGGAAAWSALFQGRTRKIASIIFALTLLGLALMNVFVWKTLV